MCKASDQEMVPRSNTVIQELIASFRHRQGLDNFNQLPLLVALLTCSTNGARCTACRASDQGTKLRSNAIIQEPVDVFQGVARY